MSKKLSKEEFKDALGQLLISMKVYSASACQISPVEFDSLVRESLSSFHEPVPMVYEGNVIAFPTSKAPILYN
jgi:hypothetical protein